VPHLNGGALSRRRILAGAGGLAIGATTVGLVAPRFASASAVARGVDYAWAHPSTTALRQAGYTFVSRYLSWDAPKNLSPEEARALKAAGIDIVCNWEAVANEARQGYAKGVTSAREAQRQAVTCGQPAGRPIYFSVDYDAPLSDQAALNAYFDGVASVIGRSRTGAYGGYPVISRLFDAGKITWGWQTYAWSGGRWDARAQVRQVQNNILVGGVDCDRDEAWTTDFGQWGATPTTSVMPRVGNDEVITVSDGRVALYTVRGDGNVWGRSQAQPGGTFGPWQQLSTGGGFASKVAVVRDASDRIALYARRGGTVFGASQAVAGGAFSSWIQIGTPIGLTGDPTAVYGSAGVIAIYGSTSSGDVWGVNQVSAGGGWGSWQQLSTGGGFTGKPAVVVDGSARIAIYARRNGTIYGASQATAGGAFSSWIPIGSNSPGVTGDPAAVYGYGGVIAIYATAGGGDVWGVNQVSAGGSWGSWQQLSTGGGFTGKPGAIVDANARIALYLRRGGTVYGASQAAAGGAFSTWIPIGTNGAGIIGDPGAVHGVGGVIAIYAKTSVNDESGVCQTVAGGSFGSWVRL
jgi:hypothetical protein